MGGERLRVQIQSISSGLYFFKWTQRLSCPKLYKVVFTYLYARTHKRDCQHLGETLATFVNMVVLTKLLCGSGLGGCGNLGGCGLGGCSLGGSGLGGCGLSGSSGGDGSSLDALCII